jgi:hypothetical protein
MVAGLTLYVGADFVWVFEILQRLTSKAPLATDLPLWRKVGGLVRNGLNNIGTTAFDATTAADAVGREKVKAIVKEAISERDMLWQLIRETALAQRAAGVEVAKRAPNRRKRHHRAPRPITARQAQALDEVSRCAGNYTMAAKAMGCTAPTVRQHFEAGMKKLAPAIQRAYTRQLRKPRKRDLPHDRDGQVDAFRTADGTARLGSHASTTQHDE